MMARSAVKFHEVVAVMLVCHIGRCLAVTTLEYQINGEDFYVNFMAPKKPLLVKEACKRWPFYRWAGSDELLKEKLSNVKVQLKSAKESQSKPTVIDQFLNAAGNFEMFYDVTEGSVDVQRSIILPSMLLSCRHLFYQFKCFGKASINGSATTEVIVDVVCFNYDAFIGLMKGRANVKIGNDTAFILQRGDLLYAPPGSCIEFEKEGAVIYVVFRWRRDGSVVDCGRPSVFEMTRLHPDLNESPIYLDHSLPHKTLNTGFKIPPIGLGTARMFEKTYDSVAIALEIGYRLIDTAQIYSGDSGKDNFQISSEHEVGRAMKDSRIDRGDLFIVTKINPDLQSRDDILKSVDRSLSELQVDYIDLLLLHDFDVGRGCGPSDAECQASPWIAWRVLEKLQERGVARSIGVSNIDPGSLRYLIGNFSTKKISVVQNWFDPFHQDKEVRKICKVNNISYMGYSTLGTTWTDEGIDYDVNPVFNHDVIIEAASITDLPVTSYVLRWAMYHDVIVIPCSTNPIHLEKNFASIAQNIHEQSISNVDDLDNILGNPDDELWVKTVFPKEIRKKRNAANTKDEL